MKMLAVTLENWKFEAVKHLLEEPTLLILENLSTTICLRLYIMQYANCDVKLITFTTYS